MGFETVSKPFQSKAAFSALGRVTSYTLSFSGFENSNPEIHGDEESKNHSLLPQKDLNRASVSLPKLRLLHLPKAIASPHPVELKVKGFTGFLDTLDLLFSQRIKARFPFPCPSPKQAFTFPGTQ